MSLFSIKEKKKINLHSLRFALLWQGIQLPVLEILFCKSDLSLEWTSFPPDWSLVRKWDNDSTSPLEVNHSPNGDWVYFQGRQLYQNWFLFPFWEGLYYKRKDCIPKGNKFFPFRVDSFLAGPWYAESKQEVTKVVSL